MNKWGTVPIFARRKWDCPLANYDSYRFTDPNLEPQVLHKSRVSSQLFAPGAELLDRDVAEPGP
jgi:hypothetical protein